MTIVLNRVYLVLSLIILLAGLAIGGIITTSNPALAAECKTDFCKLSQTTRDLAQHPYFVEGSTSKIFTGGNCVDFTIEAYNRLAQKGMTNLKQVVLAKGELSHMVLLVNDKWVISAGPDAVRILTPAYFDQWDEVYGL